MRLKLALLAAFLLWCIPAKAQDFVQSYNFVNTGTNGPTTSFANTGVTSFFISWSPQVSLSACSIQVDSSSDGASWGSGDLIASTSCTTAGSSVATSLGAGKNFVRVHVTALTGNGGLNVNLKGWGGVGGGITQVATLPALPCTNNATAQLTVAPFGIYTCIQGVWSLDAPTGNVVYATNYGVQTGFRIFDAKFANGSSTILQNGEGLFTSAMNGWTCYGTTTSGGGTNHIGAKVAMTEGTITVVDANTATSTGAGNANAAGTFSQALICGPIMDTQLSAAETAAWGSQGSCSTLMLPAGIVILEKGHFQSMPCIGGMFGALEKAATVMGYGYKISLLTTTPNFDFTTCLGGTSNNDCFGGPNGAHYFMFGIWGGENGTANPATPKNIMGLTADNQMSFVWIVGWGASPTSGNLVGLNIGTIGQYQITGGVDGAGFVACDMAGVFIQLSAMFCGDVAGDVIDIESGAQVRDFGSTYGVQGASAGIIRNKGGDYWGYGISCISQTAGNGACIRADSGNTYLDGLRSPSGQVPAQGVWVHGGNVTLKNSTASGATNPVLVDAGKYFDQGGNVFNGGGANSFIAGSLVADGHSVKGTCTGSATASSTLGLYGTGPNATTTTCNSTTIGSGFPVSGARTLQNLNCSVGVAGTTSSTCTVLVNGGASTITCNIAGAATNCSDGTHTVALNDGDLVSIEFISGAATTPTGVKAIVEWQ